ncbi:MAG: hypothetical protein HYU88_02100 [Chloroflexi bacterium]|nr:hypothetical protein [Chloroflexota bacterium]MBI4507407.1 hypothetical protein [Chloroflexota bacterium]
MRPIEFQKPDHAPSGRSRTHSTIQMFFLRRLERLVRVGRDLGSSLPAEDWRVKLLRRSIYATYYECLELGTSEEARQILAQSSSN